MSGVRLAASVSLCDARIGDRVRVFWLIGQNVHRVYAHDRLAVSLCVLTKSCRHVHGSTNTSMRYSENYKAKLWDKCARIYRKSNTRPGNTQLLACLQVDILHCKYRCILALGVEHSVRLAASKQVTNAAERLKRTKEQTIYGTKSRKQLREEEEEAVRCFSVC
jgi:hypothetical protein